jgi:hypothetical protein
VWPGLAGQHPIAALPHSSLSHVPRSVPLGPDATRPRMSVVQRRVAHAPPLSPVAQPRRRPCPMARGRSQPCPLPRTANCHAQGPLSLVSLPPRGNEPTPPISLSHSPPHVRGFEQAAGASLRSVSCPCPISSSPHSPPPTQPPHRLLPLETPPPLWFLPEHHRRPPLSVSTTA